MCKSFDDIIRHIDLMNDKDADEHQIEIGDPSEIAEQLGTCTFEN